MTIKLNQVYKQNLRDYYVIVTGKKGGKWKVNVMTDKTGVYAGSHTLSEHVIKKRYTICEKF